MRRCILMKIYLRQHRTIRVCGLRSRFFRQIVQIFRGQPDGCQGKAVQDDGTKIKQDVHSYLCGAALIINLNEREKY